MEELLLACMKTALQEHERKSRAKVANPRKPKAEGKTNSRHVPAAVKREVWERDEGRCTFLAEDGKRCGSTFLLELHHREAFAKGGETSASNLTIHCKAHNDLEARRVFGEAVMDRFHSPPAAEP